ncbi:MAG: shikimate kinase AroL [Desulfovibrio sp.]|nr:shikimate kinase AroL [Desulfovibrio sp.]
MPRAEFTDRLAAALSLPTRRGSWARGIERAAPAPPLPARQAATRNICGPACAAGRRPLRKEARNSAAQAASGAGRRLLPRCLFLIGGRCSGKSTVGVILARILNLPLHDTDRMIEDETGSNAAEIVSREGWPGFRGRESRALARAVEAGGVIAGGGGVILAEENRALMRASGLVFYLAAPAQTLYERMRDAGNFSGRPSLTGADPLEETAAVMAGREALYLECAHYVLDAAQPARQTAFAAARILKREAFGP